MRVEPGVTTDKKIGNTKYSKLGNTKCAKRDEKLIDYVRNDNYRNENGENG